MVIRFTDPLDALLAFQRALDASRTSDWFGPSTTSTGAYPPLNVFRKDHDFVIVAEIPGASKSDLDVQVKNREVRITGSKSVDYGKVSLHRRERVAGDFDRTVTMPADIDALGVRAEYRDGILAVYLPRAEKDKPRSIAID